MNALERFAVAGAATVIGVALLVAGATAIGFLTARCSSRTRGPAEAPRAWWDR